VTGALDFLSPGLAEPAAVARSSLERCQRDAGATFEERGGWLVPVSIPGEDAHLAHVGIADLSHVTKLEVRPAGDAPEAPGSVWYPLSRRRALCFCHVPQLEAVRSALADRLVVDLTGGLAILALAGPEARTLLRRLTHLHHFPTGGDVAHVTAHVLERPPGYWIVCPQEVGHYLWEVAVDRAAPLGGGPVGVDALGGLR
jgi:glycine cleavage system aminomethyltransferase T